jgi:hypothetical protein
MPKRLLPRPSKEPTHKLSTQCNYRPNDDDMTRRQALAACLENKTFSYVSMVRRLNLIRNLQGPHLDKYRAIYTSDIEWLQTYVAKIRSQRHRPREYMLKATEQCRHVEFLVPIEYDAKRTTPTQVVSKFKTRWNNPAARTKVCLCTLPAKYPSYPYHLYVRGPRATTLKARKRRVQRNDTASRKPSQGTECTIHMLLDIPKGVDEAKLRRRVRTRIMSLDLGVKTDKVRVLKYPSNAF